MVLNFIFRIPAMMIISLRKEQQKRKLSRRVRKATLIIDEIPLWQKKDLNINVHDLESYKHRM